MPWLTWRAPRIALGLGALGCMAAGMAAAQTAADQTKAVAAVAFPAGAYALGIGDTIAVTVFDHNDLAGQFLIGADGAIRHPLIGAVAAAERTRADIENDLKQRFTRLLSYDVRLSVDIATYRPVFVIGDVVRPGELPYTPGMSAFTALAKAGGTPSARQLPPNQIAEAALAERDLRVAETELYGLLLRRGALDAALADAPEIAIPAELKPMRQSPLVVELLAREVAVLDGERARVRQSREMTRLQQKQLDAEIAALTREQAALDAQTKLIDAELQNMQGLARKGLVTSDRVLSLQQFKTENEADRYRMTAFMSRATQQQTQLEASQQREEETLRQDRLRQRLAVASDIERARARIDAARIQLASRSQVAVADQLFGRTEAAFTITRSGAREPQIVSAGNTTPLLPGDVLEVRLAPLGAATSERDGGKPSATLAARPTAMME